MIDNNVMHERQLSQMENGCLEPFIFTLEPMGTYQKLIKGWPIIHGAGEK